MRIISKMCMMERWKYHSTCFVALLLLFMMRHFYTDVKIVITRFN